jgi:hypothetical protein
MKKIFTGLLFLLLCAQSAWGGDPFFQSTGWVANGSRFEAQKEFTSAAPKPALFSAEVRENPGDYLGSGYRASDEPVEETLPNLDITSLKNKLKVFLDDSVQLSLTFFDDSQSFKPGYEYAAVDSFDNDPLGEKQEDRLSTFVVIKIDF